MPSYFGARRALLSTQYNGPLAFIPSSQSPSQGGVNSVLTFSNNDRTVTDNGPNGWQHTVKTYYPKYSGKWFIEFYINSAFISYIGVGTANYDTAQNNGNMNVGQNTNSIGWYSDGTNYPSNIFYAGTNYANTSVYTAGTYIQISYDLTGAGVNVLFWLNGAQQGGSNLNGVLSSSQGIIPLWSDVRTGASATISAVPVYPISGFTYLGPG